MKQQNIRAKTKRKFKVTTDSKHSLPVAPNLLDRQFWADQPNQVWLAYITYFPTREGWLYLSTVLNLHSRKIIGWAMSNRMTRQLAIDCHTHCHLEKETTQRSPSSLRSWQSILLE